MNKTFTVTKVFIRFNSAKKIQRYLYLARLQTVKTQIIKNSSLKFECRQENLLKNRSELKRFSWRELK